MKGYHQVASVAYKQPIYTHSIQPNSKEVKRYERFRERQREQANYLTFLRRVQRKTPQKELSLDDVVDKIVDGEIACATLSKTKGLHYNPDPENGIVPLYKKAQIVTTLKKVLKSVSRYRLDASEVRYILFDEKKKTVQEKKGLNLTLKGAFKDKSPLPIGVELKVNGKILGIYALNFEEFDITSFDRKTPINILKYKYYSTEKYFLALDGELTVLDEYDAFTVSFLEGLGYLVGNIRNFAQPFTKERPKIKKQPEIEKPKLESKIPNKTIFQKRYEDLQKKIAMPWKPPKSNKRKRGSSAIKSLDLTTSNWEENDKINPDWKDTLNEKKFELQEHEDPKGFAKEKRKRELCAKLDSLAREHDRKKRDAKNWKKKIVRTTKKGGCAAALDELLKMKKEREATLALREQPYQK